MKKLLFTTFVVLATLQSLSPTEAFIIKTISFEKGFGVPVATVPSPDAAAVAFAASKDALVQTVSNAVTEKINTLTAFVNSLVQLKAKAKTDLWRTTVNAGTGVISSVNGIIAAKPTVFTKTFTVGFKPIYTTIIPATVPTTLSSGVVTTTTGQSSGYYRRRSYY